MRTDTMANKRHVTKGNVFVDLGFSREEADVLAMRVQIALEIEKYIQRKKLTQKAAAEFFNTTQPKISKIMKGKINEFSIDYLARMVGKTGKRPRVSFQRGRAAA